MTEQKKKKAGKIENGRPKKKVSDGKENDASTATFRSEREMGPLYTVFLVSSQAKFDKPMVTICVVQVDSIFDRFYVLT